MLRQFRVQSFERPAQPASSHIPVFPDDEGLVFAAGCGLRVTGYGLRVKAPLTVVPEIAQQLSGICVSRMAQIPGQARDDEGLVFTARCGLRVTLPTVIPYMDSSLITRYL